MLWIIISDIQLTRELIFKLPVASRVKSGNEKKRSPQKERWVRQERLFNRFTPPPPYTTRSYSHLIHGENSNLKLRVLYGHFEHMWSKMLINIYYTDKNWPKLLTKDKKNPSQYEVCVFFCTQIAYTSTERCLS